MIGTDVRGRALAPDMLLAGGQGQAPGPPPEAIARLAHQPAGHLTQMCQPGRHETDSGPAELRRKSEALPFANRDIGAEFARRLQEAKRQRLGGNRDSNPALRLVSAAAPPNGSTIPNALGYPEHRAQQPIIRETLQGGEIDRTALRIERDFDHLEVLQRAQVGADRVAVVRP